MGNVDRRCSKGNYKGSRCLKFNLIPTSNGNFQVELIRLVHLKASVYIKAK